MPTDDLDMAFSPETLTELGKLQIKMARTAKGGIRRKLLKLVKEYDPNYQLPGDMQVADLREELAAKFANDQIEANKKAVQDKLERQRAGLLDGTTLPGRRFEDEQIKDIEKVMEKYGLADYEAGAKIYAAELKPARPNGGRPSHSGANWTFPQIDGLLDDPAAAARNAAYGVIDELRGANR